MSSDVLPHEKEVRASHLEFNRFFREEATRVRHRLGVPEGGFVCPGNAIRWRRSHCEENEASTDTYEADLDAPRTPEGWNQLLKQESWAFDPAQTQVPLYADALLLVERYALPDWAFFPVVWYLLKGQWWFPHRDGELLPYPPPFGHPPPFGPRPLRPLKVDYPTDSECLLTIPIDEYTTKKELESLWPIVQQLRHELRQRTGVCPPSRKLGVSPKWKEQFDRDIRWHVLWRKLGSVEKVAQHLSKECDAGDIPIETIRGAVRQVEDRMKPREKAPP